MSVLFYQPDILLYVLHIGTLLFSYQNISSLLLRTAAYTTYHYKVQYFDDIPYGNISILYLQVHIWYSFKSTKFFCYHALKIIYFFPPAIWPSRVSFILFFILCSGFLYLII